MLTFAQFITEASIIPGLKPIKHVQSGGNNFVQALLPKPIKLKPKFMQKQKTMMPKFMQKKVKKKPLTAKSKIGALKKKMPGMAKPIQSPKPLPTMLGGMLKRGIKKIFGARRP